MGVNGSDDNGQKIGTDAQLAVSILVSDKRVDYNYDKYLKKNYSIGKISLNFRLGLSDDLNTVFYHMLNRILQLF